MIHLESFFSKKKDDDIAEELIQQIKDPKIFLNNYEYRSDEHGYSWKFEIKKYTFKIYLFISQDPFTSNSYSIYLEDKKLEVSKGLIKKIISLIKKKAKATEEFEDSDDFDSDPRRHFRSDNQIIKESIDFLHNLDDEELREKMQDLILERKELDDQIQFIGGILRDRKSQRAEEKAQGFPKSIFDFNKEQLEFIFEHNQSTNEKQYEISTKYFGQLYGVYPSGFNNETNQFHFKIVSRLCMNEDEDGFELDEKIVESIKFLGNNLKKMEGGYVYFGVLSSYEESYRTRIHYFSESHIEYGSEYGMRRMGSISKMLEYIVDADLMAKDY